MTGSELGLCMSAVLCSSVSQLVFKSASAPARLAKVFLLLGLGGGLQLGSVLLAVVVLRTLQLSQLVPFAAAAYFLVPIGSHFVFNERLLPRFWLGALLIVIGILCANA